MIDVLRANVARLIVVAVIATLYVLARPPVISKTERLDLAGGFRFSSHPLAELPGAQYKSIRTVNPSLRRIAGWVSATGAGVALNDIDGDGLANDLCSVDPRTDRVMISPAPTTGDRYAPFTLDAAALYDPATMAPMGCIPGDFNEDGSEDLLVYYWGRTPIAFLAKRKEGSESLHPSADKYQPVEVVAGGDRWNTGAATLADLDGDGHLDIVIGNYYADGARILDAKANTQEKMQHSMTRAFNGGRSRVLRWLSATKGSQPSVRYEEVLDYVNGSPDEKERLTHGWTLAVGAYDLDEDLLPELYFANDFGPDRLLYNRSKPGQIRFDALTGKKYLTTPSSKVLGKDGFKGMGVDFADLNGDALTDIFVSNIAADYALEESHFAFINTGQNQQMRNGVAPFIDQSEALGLSRSGWGWDVKLGDFNNDGILEIVQATGFVSGEINCWPELHELAMGNDQLLESPSVWFQIDGRCGLSDRDRNPFFVRAHDGRYYDISAELGLDKTEISRGIAIADVDADGRLDFAVANQYEASSLYRNESVSSGGVLGLNLRLPLESSPSNATQICSGYTKTSTPTVAAVGAFASVRLLNGKQLVSQVDGGNGHSGKRSNELHFGLGTLPPGAKLQVLLRWRDLNGKVNQQQLELSPGLYTVTLGEAERRNDGCN
jgi:hypothetical protein